MPFSTNRVMETLPSLMSCQYCKYLGCIKLAKYDGLCAMHRLGKRCQMEDCCRIVSHDGDQYCNAHYYRHATHIDFLKYQKQNTTDIQQRKTKPLFRRRNCKAEGCPKSSQSGGYCISHGGGKRCNMEGCAKLAVTKGLCVGHGGGKRCQSLECTKSAKHGGFCISHGGGSRCQTPGCTKSAKEGSHCITHGGGTKCSFLGCHKSAKSKGLCVAHGGGRRCSYQFCPKSAQRFGLCYVHGGSRRKPSNLRELE